MVSAGCVQTLLTLLTCAKAQEKPQCYQMDFHRLYPAGHETTVTALSVFLYTETSTNMRGLGLGVRTGFTNMF